MYKCLLILDIEPGYQYYPLKSCQSRNELYSGSVASRGKCSAKCNQKNECVSFEWYGNSNLRQYEEDYEEDYLEDYEEDNCYLSSSCTYGISRVSTQPVALYVKGDNVQFKF